MEYKKVTVRGKRTIHVQFWVTEEHSLIIGQIASQFGIKPNLACRALLNAGIRAALELGTEVLGKKARNQILNGGVK